MTVVMRARDLLVQVATHGENIVYEVPCLIVVAKDDLDQSSQALQGSTRLRQDMGIETPIPIGEVEGLQHIFSRIIHAAQQPHLSIPETKASWENTQTVPSTPNSLPHGCLSWSYCCSCGNSCLPHLCC